MNIKRFFSLTIALFAVAAVFLPASAPAADNKDDLSVYLRPAIRFGTDDRVLYILDFLAPVYRGNKGLLFVNGKFTQDNHEAWETNLGVGYRRLVMDDRLVLGGNLFYDHRKTRYGSHFDQLGLGFEAMAEPGGIGVTGRFNYYQPLTRAKLGGDFGYVFYGNGIYTAGIEEAMTGFDYEAGVRIPWVSNYVETWVYAGGYHYFGCNTPDVNGVSARIEATPTDFLRVSFEFRDDTVNNEEFYGEVAFEVPFSIDNLVAGKNPFEGIGDVLTGSRTLKERMVEPVHRDVDIVVGKDYLSGADAAGGDGDLAAGVIFVADNADTGGDGSFEHPYDSLTDANNDARLGDTVSIVHVLTGDGTGLAGESFGQDGITIWGAGAVNPLYSNVVNFVQGYPVITSTLTMNAQNMTVLGLDFENPGTYGIYIGNGAYGAGLSIFSNIIYGASGYGIIYGNEGDLGTSDDPVIIRDNTITNTDDGYAVGIGLYSNGDIYAEILHNDIDGVYGNTGAYGIDISTNGSFFGDISGNRIANIHSYGYGDAYGIYIGVNGDVVGSISNNDISGIQTYSSLAAGIFAWAGDNFTGSITGNSVSGVRTYATGGEYAYAYGIYAGSSGDFTGSISNNTVTDVEADYGYHTNATGIYTYVYGDNNGTISGNTVDDIYADYGYYETVANGIYAYADNDFGGTISGNTVSDVLAEENYSDGFNAAFGILGEAGGDFNGSITNNRISNITANYGEYCIAGGVGINFDSWWDYYETGSFSGTISGNTISGVTAYYAYEDTEAYGVFGFAYDDFGGSITGNTLTGISAAYLAYGIYLGISSGGGDITTSVTDNVIGVTGGSYAYGLYAQSNYGILGTLSSPMLFTGNSGSVNAPTAYLAYLYTTDPGASSVFIGHNRSVNNFTTTGTWNGNYPYAGGSIWATDSGSFINR